MIKNQGDRYHLIDKNALEEKKLDSNELTEFVKSSGLIDIGKKYNIVSIIGSQSTGKSTLLNYLFGTQFDVQNRQQSVGQTTVGIWISKDVKNNVVVLDVEGSDSVERKSGENMVENQTALMALAMSHCFIINVFVNALGQHTSCQLSIIKIIMQQNLKLFQQDTVKHIIFVVRDWDEEYNYDEASRKLNGYLLNIWNEIPKPDQYRETDFHELFSVQVVTLVYYKLKNEFAEQTNQLHSKLANQQDPNFIFKDFDYEKNVRWSDMPQYLSNIWVVIANNKDLNLPNEKILISNMRCQQIKLEALEGVKDLTEDLQNRVRTQFVENFGQQCLSILGVAQKIYDKDAKDYHADVYKEKEKELRDELMNKFYTYFQRQTESLKQHYMNRLSENLETLKRESIYDLPDKLNEVDLLKVNFEESLSKSVIEKGLWQEQDHVGFFNQQFDNQLKSFVEAQLASFKQQLDNIIKSECDKIVSQQVLNISPKFWSQIDADYYTMISDKYSKYDALLSGLRVQWKQIDDYLSKFEEDSFHNLKQVIAVASGRFKDQLFQQFKAQFVRTEDGQPRNWQKTTEEEIFHIYTEARDKVFSFLDILRIRKVKFIRIQQTMKKIAKTHLAPFTPLKEKISYQISADTDSDDVVLNEVFYTQVKMQLAEDIDVQYQDAIQKHKQDFLQNIPKPFWFLLLFFMYDDVLRWMGNPLFLYPILIILCFIGFCIAIGLHSLPKLAFQTVFRTINQALLPLIFGGISKLKTS
ncbi:unnamed protein product (macronuclear) [Paramecium tetraurelia]|uniref:Protein SEY1 homolog 1 n=1 Tax=Paramecium tetraurelia TaxID=5888 RepID=SEY11_PARTE|nr:uncharacterized protein GSPATT00029660001 [Paramecium tetraurelia]A0BKG2.1 RecName: Full=Protein SEY1 homolog 1 [Paramecium tetraurelia]CAK59029.1 unnamed protein product [Paramecium tetraurelia]|eukprot:XP_001426427.1 hypothetical protein (macronuclear) [Paramecium tetraurelia strain d4-2]